MNLIVAVDQNFGIGINQNLLYSLKKDMDYFKKVTMGKIVIMGENTLFSLPNKKPLPNRTNLILSNNPNLVVDGAKVFNDLPSLLKYVALLNTDNVFVIGGAMIYALMLPYCKKAYITHIFKSKPADKFFPDITKIPSWKVIEKSEIQKEGEVEFAFYVYQNSNPLSLI